MGKTVQIATMGKYQAGRLSFVLYKREWDELVILHSRLSEQNAKAIKGEVGEQLPVRLEVVDPWNYRDVLAKALDVAYENRKATLNFNASLGTRVMTSALIMAAMFTDSSVFLIREDEGKATDIIEILPIKRTMLSEPKKNILRKLVASANDCILQQDIGSRASLSASTISGHLRELDLAGYITKTSGKMGNTICITRLGKIMLRVAQHWKGS